MAGFKVYNADEVDMAIGPALIESGLADGEFLRFEQDADDTEDVVGADGEVAVSRTNDRRATLTVLLMQTSDGNDKLSVLSNLTRESPGMTGAIFPVAVKDKNGRTVITAANCWVSRSPDRSFDRTAQTNEWKVRLAQFVRFDGGN